MFTFVDLCRDLFILAQVGTPEAGVRRGRAWEERIASLLASRAVPVEALPGGIRLFGHVSLSGLAHQIDGALGCSDALVVGEWKAHEGAMPKNELLRFKAVTDDFFMSFGHPSPARPLIRIFGGTGIASNALRTYAALHGIVLLDRATWPAPVLASNATSWTNSSWLGPDSHEAAALCFLGRPMQRVLVARPDGSFLVPAPLNSAAIDSILHMHDRWSDAMWETVDLMPSTWEKMSARVIDGRAIA